MNYTVEQQNEMRKKIELGVSRINELQQSSEVEKNYNEIFQLSVMICKLCIELKDYQNAVIAHNHMLEISLAMGDKGHEYLEHSYLHMINNIEDKLSTDALIDIKKTIDYYLKSEGEDELINSGDFVDFCAKLFEPEDKKEDKTINDKEYLCIIDPETDEEDIFIEDNQIEVYSVITLDDGSEYMIVSKTIFEDKIYSMALELTDGDLEKFNPIILLETLNNGQIYIELVTDKKLVRTLTIKLSLNVMFED